FTWIDHNTHQFDIPTGQLNVDNPSLSFSSQSILSGNTLTDMSSSEREDLKVPGEERKACKTHTSSWGRASVR
ncbi:hypothetical protein STEG23_012001, partial [Scotinomys teguina]